MFSPFTGLFHILIDVLLVDHSLFSTGYNFIGRPWDYYEGSAMLS